MVNFIGNDNEIHTGKIQWKLPKKLKQWQKKKLILDK